MVWSSILLAGLFLYLALRDLDWANFGSTLQNANYLYMPIIFIWGSMTSWTRAIRWRILLTVEKPIPVQKVFWANMAGYLGNSVLPARAGELVRAVYAGKENDISTTFVLATGLIERFADLIALVILGSVSLANAGILSEPLQSALSIMSMIAIVGFIGIMFAPYLGHKLINIVSALSVINTSVKDKTEGFLKQSLRGVEALHHPTRAGMFIFFTFIVWAMDGIGATVLAQALQLQLTLVQSFLLLAGLGLSSAIPSTPGYVGIYQFVAVIVLQPFGISKPNALAFIIFLQVLNVLIIACWGGFAIWRAPSFIKQAQ